MHDHPHSDSLSLLLRHAPPARPHSGETWRGVRWMYLLACLPAVAVGTAVFGVGVLGICLWAMLAALLGEYGFAYFTRKRAEIANGHALVIGLMAAMTCPPTVPWYVPVAGGLAGTFLGKGILGGSGHYLWQPALVGWAMMRLLFGDHLSPDFWPLLSKTHIFSGSIEHLCRPQAYFGWLETRPSPGCDGWELPLPVKALSSAYRASGRLLLEDSSLTALLRDLLPPWRDTLWGTAPGGIGETSAVALLAGGLFLIYRGYVRWQLPVAALFSAAGVAAVWPVTAAETGWFPVLQIEHGLPVGVVWVMYHLTCGGLLMGCLLLGADSVSTPLTGRGQWWFGIGVGGLTMLLRIQGIVPGSCYWAILAMNTLTPLIDRYTKRTPPQATSRLARSTPE